MGFGRLRYLCDELTLPSYQIRIAFIQVHESRHESGGIESPGATAKASYPTAETTKEEDALLDDPIFMPSVGKIRLR